MLLKSPIQRRVLSRRALSLLAIPKPPTAFSTAIAKIDVLQPHSLAKLPAAQITTLPNGLRVATERTPHNDHTATVGVWIQAGSRYETPENNGCAHFLEHLAFKGTQRRSRLQLEREVEDIGGHLNAYTSREQTTYFASVMKGHLPQAVDILADILLCSKLSPAAIEAERSTILQEAKEVYKDMEEYIFDQLHEVAFMKTPLGQTILGPEKNINTLSRQDLQHYVARHYTPDRMVLAGAGAVDHAAMVRLAEQKFGKMAPAGRPGAAAAFEPARYVGGDFRERQDDLPLAHVAIAYRTCGWSDPDTFPLLMMHALLGSWEAKQPHGAHSNSRLVSTVASYRYGEKVMPFNTLYQDTGLFGIYCSAYEGRLLDMANCLMTSLRELVNHVSDAQLDEVRNQLATNALAGMESSSQLCEELGRQVLTYGRKMTAAEFVARLNAVDAAAVKAAAGRFLHDQDHSMAAVGPIVELPTYPWFRRRSYSLVN